MTDVKNSLLTFINQGAFLILYLVLDLSFSEVWTLWGPFPKQQETGDGFRLALIILPSGLRLSHWWTLGMWMPKCLCGRTLSLGLRFLISSSQTTDFNLIAKLSEGTVVNWVSGIGIPLWLISRGMSKAETVNKVIMNGLKKRLDDAKCKWVDELPHVLWTY